MDSATGQWIWIMRKPAFPTTIYGLVLAFCLGAAPAVAADRSGDYSVRGAGSQKCSAFTSVVEEKKPELGSYIGYIDGSLTTASRLTPDAFDVNPFILPGPFAAIVINICKQSPDQLLDLAIRGAIDALVKVRVPQASPVIEMTVGQNRMSLRAETLQAVQTKLKALKLLKDKPDGKFGKATEDALRQFQKANRLTETGLPDPDTVLSLLVRQ